MRKNSCYARIIDRNIVSIPRKDSVEGMWVFLPIVCLLMRVILGYPETDDTFSNAIRLENEGNDALDNRARKSATDASRDWKKEEPFSTLDDKKQTDPTDIMAGGPRRGSEHLGNKENRGNYRHVRGIGSNAKIVTKRRENVGPWHESQTKDKGIQNPADNKKDPWIYWWGDKRISLYGSNPSIHRPIRVPFNSWGGKRGKDFSRSNVRVESKRMDDSDTYDEYDIRGVFELKNTGKKVSLRDILGKRGRKEPADQEPDRQQLELMTGSSNYNDDAPTMFGAVKDKFAKGGEFGQEADREQVIDKWDNKRNYFLYRFPLHEINHTTDQDYMTEGEIANNNNNNNDNDDNDNRLTSMPDKRAKDGQVQRAAFNTGSGGKGSLKYRIEFDSGYRVALLPEGKAYFFWAG